MRGKVHKEVCNKLRFGITPAHAGKRKTTQGGEGKKQDHPRTCGEKGFKEASGQFIGGSPPHMRGKDFFLLYWLLADGITPAHAGKSLQICRETRRLQDHPRMCGEKAYSREIFS